MKAQTLYCVGVVHENGNFTLDMELDFNEGGYDGTAMFREKEWAIEHANDYLECEKENHRQPGQVHIRTLLVTELEREVL